MQRWFITATAFLALLMLLIPGVHAGNPTSVPFAAGSSDCLNEWPHPKFSPTMALIQSVSF